MPDNVLIGPTPRCDLSFKNRQYSRRERPFIHHALPYTRLTTGCTYELKQMQFPYTVNGMCTVYAEANYLGRNLYSNLPISASYSLHLGTVACCIRAAVNFVCLRKHFWHLKAQLKFTTLEVEGN